MRLAGIFACLTSTAWSQEAPSQGNCHGAGCDDDDLGLLQLGPLPTTAPGPMQCPAPFPYSVCPTTDLEGRCKFLMEFTVGGGALHDGIVAVTPCTKTTPVNQECFTDDAYEGYFSNYSKSYSDSEGLHAAWVWGKKGLAPSSYSRQNGRDVIAQYYWQFVGFNSFGFDFNVYPETLNANYSIEHDSCTVVSHDDKPSYIFFGFFSEAFLYAGGTAILDKEGRILRQYATGAGDLKQDKTTPGYVEDYSKSFGTAGKVARTLTKYWSALKSGNARVLLQLYAPDARVSFYNKLSSSGLTVFAGKKAIKSYLKQLVKHFGRKDLCTAKSYLQLAEETTSSVPGNGHYTYTVGDSKLGVTLIISKCGRIFGEGVFAEVEGLELSN